MAKKGISKCKNCEQEFPTSGMIIYSNKKYCKSCGEKKLQESEQYNTLIKTICIYFNIEVPTGLILKQIKQYKAEFQYEYTGMTYTLWYLKEIKRNSFEEKYGIALIKYEYENAKNYFLQQQSIQNSVNNIKHEEKIREIKVNSKKQNRNLYLVNIDELLEDGEN
jgi:NAD-dependent SIR2 family protein deacetylase